VIKLLKKCHSVASGTPYILYYRLMMHGKSNIKFEGYNKLIVEVAREQGTEEDGWV